MNHSQKFDKQNFDKLIVGFKGEALEKNVGRKNFDESLAIHQNHQSFSPSNFALYGISNDDAQSGGSILCS